MKSITNFLLGYPHSKRQECKSRSRKGANGESLWKNQDNQDPVVAVSFSLGGVDTDPQDASIFAHTQGYPESEENRKSQISHDHTLTLLPNASFPSDILGSNSRLMRDNNFEKSRNGSRSERSSSIALSADEKRKIKSASSSCLIAHEASVSGHLDKEGEWMYQLTALAKEHAQRNKTSMAPKSAKSEKNDDIIGRYL